MRKQGKAHFNLKTVLGMAVMTAVLAVALMTDAFSTVSHAASAGKVSATSANVRKEPNAKSDAVTGVTQNMELSVTGQTTGSDGYTWYQVEVDGVTGYVRSDLVTITDGSTPPTLRAATGTGTASTPTTSTPDEPVVSVTAVEPVGGKIKGSTPVRVRQNASTTSRIVTTTEGGLVLTVTGTADGTDGKKWYQVEYIANGSQVQGFVRSDFVNLDGDLVPAGTTEEPEPVQPDEGVTPEPVQEVKAWDTFYQEGSWHLVDNSTGNVYDPQKMIDSVAANTETLNNALSKNKGQQIVIIILIILLIALATVISYLIFKIRDMNDSAYFSEIERETIRRRTADRPQGGKTATHTVGAEKRPAGQRPTGSGNGQRPAGQRPSGSGNGQRPAGQRPSGNGNGQRPAGQRPSGNGNGQRPAGQRPAGSGNGQRPAGQRPAGSGNGSGQRPAEQRPAETETEDVKLAETRVMEPISEVQEQVSEVREQIPETPAQQAPAQSEAPAQQEAPAKKHWKPKNFMADDEEFEFTFLDWDGKDE